MPEINTLEEAQAEILRLRDQLTQAQTERDTLSQNNDQLQRDLDRSRTLNNEYFNRISAQSSGHEDENNNDDEEVQSCEDFARTLEF